MKEIEMTKMVEEMDLRNLTPEVDMTDLVIATPDINRPALQLTGYYEHFANERVQIIGYVEFTYLQHLEESERRQAPHEGPVFPKRGNPDRPEQRGLQTDHTRAGRGAPLCNRIPPPAAEQGTGPLDSRRHPGHRTDKTERADALFSGN